MRGCSKITDSGIIAMSNSSNFSNLLTLNLYSTYIGDTSLVALAKSVHCKQVKELNLCGSSYFTEAGIIAIANSSNFTELTILNLGNTRVTDATLFALAQSVYCKKLKELNLELNLEGCSMITDAGIDASANSANIVI